MVKRGLERVEKSYQLLLIWKNWGLRRQIVFGVVLIQAAITLSLSVFQYFQQREQLKSQSLEDAVGVIHSLEASTLSSILISDFAEIDTLIRAHANYNGISSIEIYDREKKRIGYFSKHEPIATDPYPINHEHEMDEFSHSLQMIHRSKKHLIMSSPITHGGRVFGWITIEKDESNLNKSLFNLFVQVVMTSLGSMLIGFYLAKRLADLFLVQINELKHSVDKISAGETGVRIQHISKNELGELAIDINRMADQISDYQMKMVNSAKYSALGEMAAGIAHEINNPLAIIVAKSTNIKKLIERDQATPDRMNTELEKISKTCFRITQIVNALRNLARDGSSDPASWFDLKQCISESLELSSEKLKFANIKIDVQTVENYEIHFSRLQMSQIFINLISNSMDAIQHQDQPWILVKSEIIDQQFVIRFTDSGPGIPREIRQKIMEPFYSTKEVGKGTGLGLSISKGIVERFRGTFTYNDLSPYTEFVICLKDYRKIESGQLAA